MGENEKDEKLLEQKIEKTREVLHMMRLELRGMWYQLRSSAVVKLQKMRRKPPKDHKIKKVKNTRSPNAHAILEVDSMCNDPFIHAAKKILPKPHRKFQVAVKRFFALVKEHRIDMDKFLGADDPSIEELVADDPSIAEFLDLD